MVFLIVLVVFLFIEPVISQSNDHEINTNIPIKSFCGSIAPLNPNFFKNRNATLAEIRMKLLNEGVVYATAQDLTAGDTVYAAAQCKNYVSRDQCVACFDAGVSILVKCMEGNGAYVVFDNCFIRKGTLEWNQRYEIIFGIARGLAHLHNEFHVKIIHRDIKSNNILLTDDFKPKIADFGLARFLPEDETHVSTKFAGTLGYTAPEYARQGILSDKVDTYSFGVVVLEIISGRRSTDVKSDISSSDYLLEHAWKSYENKLHLNFIDGALMNLNQHQQEHVIKIIEIALLCTQSPASKRPTMSEVVLMLQDGQSLGTRELTRPTYVHNQERRIHIGSINRSIAADNVSKKLNELVKEQMLE